MFLFPLAAGWMQPVRFLALKGSQCAEPGICRGNEDSHGNENGKLRKNVLSMDKKLTSILFFL